jgi:hypothetical protein
MDIKRAEKLANTAKQYLKMQKDGTLDILYEMGKTPFEFFYLFSNEDLGFLFDKINVNGKSVLTVGSSGDQILYSHANGANNIVHFDINPFSEMYFDYKVAAIKELSYRDFKRAFNPKRGPVLSPETYEKISHHLPEDAKVFWESLYESDFGTTKDTQLHKEDSDFTRISKKDFLKMKLSLWEKEPNVRFINSDLQHITSKLDENDKFDYILLSNIIHYVPAWETDEPMDTFRDAVTGLAEHLNRGGSMQIGYIWQDLVSTSYLMGTRLDLNPYTVRPLGSLRMDEGSVMYTPSLSHIQYFNNSDDLEMSE